MPPKKDGRGRALIRFVQSERQIERHHRHLVAKVRKFPDQGVIAETISAIHRARARSNLHQMHRWRAWTKARWK
jgi:hypothetical protein